PLTSHSHTHAKKISFTPAPLTLRDLFLFFSGRRRHTTYWRDWSSDVCSSDLDPRREPRASAAVRVMSTSAPELLRAVRIDGTSKGMPRVSTPVPLLEAAAQGWSL